LYIREKKPIVTNKYKKWLQLLKQTNENLFIYPSTFRSTFGRVQRRPSWHGLIIKYQSVELPLLKEILCEFNIPFTILNENGIQHSLKNAMLRCFTR